MTGGTGHVNITLSGPNGWSYTYGNNTNNGSWGVRVEDNSTRDPSTINSTTYPVTYEQMMEMYNWATGILGDPNNSYGLLGQNCVDFVRDMFNVAGLTNQISSLMQWLDLPVNYYAAITDWLDANGFGGIMDGIGATLGAFGELGSMAMNAAADAWNWAGDMATAAWGFVSGIGDAVGGFFGGLADTISDFFNRIGKGNNEGGEHEETLDPQGFRMADDDFLMKGDAGGDDLTDVVVTAFNSPWSQDADIIPLFSAANDESISDITFDVVFQPISQDEYAFA